MTKQFLAIWAAIVFAPLGLGILLKLGEGPLGSTTWDEALGTGAILSLLLFIASLLFIAAAGKGREQ